MFGAGIAALPVFLAGLADGINPCAFSTLLFLLSVLTALGRTRTQIAVTGLVFSGAVFGTYLAVGYGFLAALRALSAFGLVAGVIKWTLFAALIVLASLSLYDAFLASKGRAKDMMLQLPEGMKKRIHGTIHKKSRSAALVGGALATGFLVSVFELACTGQIYLPAVTYMARLGVERGRDLLLLYNLGFILPLLILFALAYIGVGSRKAALFFQGKIAMVKIVLAFVFALFALLMLVS
jgi:cytochrome c biogenesis protein CcdA